MGLQSDFGNFTLEEKLGLIEVTTNSTYLQLINLQIERLKLNLQELQTGGDATRFMLNYHSTKVELDTYLALRKFIAESKLFIMKHIQGDTNAIL